MPFLSLHPEPETPPEPEFQPQPPDEHAFALADSFLNFDYVPPSPNQTQIGSDPPVFGSGCARVVEPEPECVKVEPLGGYGGIAGGLENVSSLGGDEVELDVQGNEGDGESPDEPEGSSDDGKGKKEDQDGGGPEEGEIVESAADDHEADVDVDNSDRARSKNEIEVPPSVVPLVNVTLQPHHRLLVPPSVIPPVNVTLEPHHRLLVPPSGVSPVNVTLEPYHRLLPVGFVTSVIGEEVTVYGTEKHKPLAVGSILWLTERRTPLGFIGEIFERKKHTSYVVRFNSANEIPTGMHGKTLVSFVPEFATHVLDSNNDLRKKGYDASREELSHEMNFSDDEKEAKYKQRMRKRGINGQNSQRGENKGKKFPPKQGAAPTFPIAPAASTHDHGLRLSFSNNGQGPFVAPAAPLLDHVYGPSFPSNVQGHFGVSVAPFPEHGHRPTFPGNEHRPPLPAAPSHDHGHSSAFSANGQHPFGATAVAPTFPLANPGANFIAGGVWTHGASFPQPQPQQQLQPQPQPQPWFPANTQIPQQFPVAGPGVPFQQQFNPSQVFPPENMFPVAQPNMYAQGQPMFAHPMFAQGSGVQNQMTFGVELALLPGSASAYVSRTAGFPIR